MPARLFFHQIGGTGRHDGNCLGGIICMWNDVRVADKDLTARHNGLAGGVMAFGERAWSGPAPDRRESAPTILPAPSDSAMTAFERFQQRMAAHRTRVPAGEMDYWAPLHAPEWLVEIDADTLSRSFTAYGDVLDLDALCAARGIPLLQDRLRSPRPLQPHLRRHRAAGPLAQLRHRERQRHAHRSAGMERT